MTPTPRDIPAPFWDHIEELRATLIKSFLIIFTGALIAFFNYKALFQLLTAPFSYVSHNQLVLLGPTDGLTTILKVCFWSSAAVTSPLWSLFLFQFISPALKENQRRFVIPFFITSFALLTAGILFAYHLTIPLANELLFGINQTIAENLWTLSSYLDYSLGLLFANAIAFEAFVILFFLVHLGSISHTQLKSKRRHVIVAIFTLSAILTPPDVLTQLLLAIPLTVLYEAVTLYSRLCKQNSN
ncbi:MAG: twin-arginine translocase subunit TatC [Waddliaceae bacterium]